MLRKLIKRIYGQQKGITGLETAIILIAFVVVAAVFAYTVLSAGLFSTQKSQEAVYSGLERTQSTMELKSSVIAKADSVATTKIGQLVFTLAIATGGESIDFTNPTSNGTGGMAADGSSNYVTMSISDKYQKVDNVYWTSSAVGLDNGNNLLEANEQFEIVVGGATTNNLVDALAVAHPLSTNSTFLVEIKTAKGAVLSFERTLPGSINAINDLH
jgi:archaeal flagellin FlaB